MKNQYFGDVNDYLTYGLLRALAGGEIALGVSWMLTPDDRGRDGGKLRYLAEPGVWRAHDPPLFDSLAAGVGAGDRRLSLCAELGLLPGARYHDEPLVAEAAARRAWQAHMLETLAAAELVFFDPDNGLEVATRPFGRRPSVKHLYWREVFATWAAGHSLLAFQHFPREPRPAYLGRRLAELRAHAPGAATGVFVTTSVAFLLAAQPRHAGALARGVARAAARWGPRIEARFPLGRR